MERLQACIKKYLMLRLGSVEWVIIMVMAIRIFTRQRAVEPLSFKETAMERFSLLQRLIRALAKMPDVVNSSGRELAIALIVVFILAGIFLRQVLILSARAEKKFLEVSVLNMNTALHYQAGLFYLKGEKQKLREMDGMNPFVLMQGGLVTPGQELDAGVYMSTVLPQKYRGEIDLPENQELEAGYWYYLVNEKTLVYTVSNDEFFSSDGGAPALVRYRVNLEYDDINSNARFDAAEDIYLGVKLKDLGGYQWRI